MSDLSEILNPTAAEPQGTAEPEAEQAQAEAAPEGAPAAPQAPETHVPLAALEAERQARKDHKGRADRFEGENAELRRQLQQFQGQPPQQQQAPVQVDPIFNARADFSELLLRQSMPDATDIDEKIEAFKRMAQADPSLTAAMQRHQHPWKFAYDKAKQVEMMNEIGTDPVAYRARLEAEIRAQMAPAPAPPAPVAIPQSLNGARSVAPRSMNAWADAEPLGAILKRRS